MSIKFSIFGKCSKFFSVFLSLSFLFCLSCDATPQNNILLKSQPISNTNSNSQNSEPALIVQKFMAYVSENKLKEANDLVKTEQEVSGTTKSSQETPKKFEETAVKLDWAQAFKERNYSLEKIVGNDVSENKAKVKALLNFNEKSRVKMGAVFSLKNVNGQWFIYDIEFVTDGTLNQ
jgi:hypothetical protein